MEPKTTRPAGLVRPGGEEDKPEKQ